MHYVLTTLGRTDVLLWKTVIGIIAWPTPRIKSEPNVWKPRSVILLELTSCDFSTCLPWGMQDVNRPHPATVTLHCTCTMLNVEWYSYTTLYIAGCGMQDAGSQQPLSTNISTNNCISWLPHQSKVHQHGPSIVHEAIVLLKLKQPTRLY